MDTSNQLLLELDASLLHDFVLDTIQRLKMSECNILISCVDGGTVFTNKKYLSVFSSVVTDICKDFPEQEKLTLQVEFTKNQVDLMMEYFNTGELRSTDVEELHEVMTLIQCLGVDIKDVELIELDVQEKPTSKRKSDVKISLGDGTRKKYMTKNIKVKEERKDIEADPLDEQSDDKFVEKNKPYECQECGKCFSTSAILYNHRGVHNPTKCDLCDRTFAQKASLKYHLEKCHHNVISI